MPSKNSTSRRAPAALVLFCVAGCIALFIIPFHIPVSPAVSDSYVFGYNNRAAELIFVVFAAAFAYWSGGLGLRVGPSGRREAGPPAMSRRLLAITLAITAVVTLTFWAAYRRVGAINEGAYLFDRLLHLASGERMYRDFEFIYGPVLLYFPLLLHRGLRLPLLDAYFMSWTVEWLLGVYLLWLTVAWVSRNSPRKNGIYLLAFLGFIFSTVSLGLNYTPLRFVLAPFFAVVIWRLGQEGRREWLRALLAVAFSAFLVFSSPEQGFAFSLGTMLYLLLFSARTGAARWTGLAVLLVGDGLLAVLFLHTGALPYIRGMAQGGYNLPLLPSLNTLILLALLVVAACVLSNALRSHERENLSGYLVLISCFALPAAFGRCDTGHLFMNTLGAFIAAWTALSYFRAAAKWMVWSYVLGALSLPLALYQANNFFMFPVKSALFSPADPHPALRRLTNLTLVRLLGAARTASELSKWRAAYPTVVPSDLLAGQSLLAPLGFPSTLLLPGMPPATNGRYRGLGNVMTASELQQKVQELESQPQTLLLFTAEAQCPPASATAPTAAAIAHADQELRRQLFLNLLPFYLPKVRNHNDLFAPLCQYVDQHYVPAPYTAPLAGGSIWQRAPGH